MAVLFFDRVECPGEYWRCQAEYLNECILFPKKQKKIYDTY